MTTPLTLDKIDLKILRILQENGRISNLDLSKEIGLSPAPTLERVRKLEAAKYILGYHAQLNAPMLGLGIMAFIQISLIRQVDNAINNFKKQIVALDEITECFQVTGDADYLVKVVTKDIAAFEKLISEKLSKIEEIGQMKTMIILSETVKQGSVPI